MARISQPAQAGTMESNDIFIRLLPTEGDGLHLELTSTVYVQYGEAIEAELRRTLANQGITDGEIIAQDRGALDCTVRARLLTALERAGVAIREGL